MHKSNEKHRNILVSLPNEHFTDFDLHAGSNDHIGNAYITVHNHSFLKLALINYLFVCRSNLLPNKSTKAGVYTLFDFLIIYLLSEYVFSRKKVEHM